MNHEDVVYEYCIKIEATKNYILHYMKKVKNVWRTKMGDARLM